MKQFGATLTNETAANFSAPALDMFRRGEIANSTFHFAAKRALDITVAGTALLILAPLFLQNTRRHWMEACLRFGVPAGEVKSVPEAFENQTVKALGVVQTLQSDHLGPVSLVRPAQGLSSQLDADYKAPPMLGEDTKAVLSDVLGYAPAEIKALIGAGVVHQFAAHAAA